MLSSILVRIIASLAASTPLQPLPLPQTNNSLSTVRCSSHPEWDSPRFSPPDCHQAILRFYHQDLVPHGGETQYEFITANYPHPMTWLRKQTLPRKYAYGKPVMDFMLILYLLVPRYMHNGSRIPLAIRTRRNPRHPS